MIPRITCGAIRASILVLMASCSGSVSGGPPGSDAVYSGWRVAALGDLDGDGASDLALQTTFDPNTSEFRPRAWFISGREERLLFALQRPIGNGTSPPFNDGCGRFQIEPIGDVDSDAVSDFVTCIPDYWGSPRHAGEVRVYSGLKRSALYRSEGNKELDSFGRRVALVGDLDRDGIGDLVGGTCILGYPESVSSWARAFSGRDGRLLWTALGPPSESSFSEEICAAGDVDEDGTPDCVIAAPSAFELAGRVSVHSGRTGAELYSLQGRGMPIAEFLGTMLHALEDVDGDECADVLVGRFQWPSQILSTRKRVLVQPAWKLYWARVLGDLDADGRMDVAGWERPQGIGTELVVASGREGRELMRLRPDGGFPQITEFGGIGDLNRDGHADLWVLSEREAEWMVDHYEPVFGSIAIYSGADGTVLRRFDREVLMAMSVRPYSMITIE